ncbi:FAD-dependent oxidoreductase [Miltoncostaea marina]|uniref:FAD-dependent oxidoreductase n=1 Tax=Miltoncostaea marina TaxID=2843215 RepID=UPI001C3D4126|nr:FAD-dependent oxidoreductase [Miltoncostaea marina]
MDAAGGIGVVGAGIVGLCTAYALLERGAAVRVYERGVPGGGQSGGASRVFRHGHDDPRMVAAAVASRAVYEEWSRRLGVEMVSRDGALALGPPAARRLPGLRAAGVPAARVAAEAVARALPPLAPLPGAAVPAVLDEAGGAIRTTAAVEALRGALGDALVTEEVLAVRDLPGGGAEVVAGGTVARHDAVVVCAGRGTAALAAGLGLAPPVALGAHVRLTFRVRGDAPARLACLQDGSGAWGETGVYAAALPGNREYAVGISEHVDAAPDGALADPGGLAALADRTRAYVRRALPGLDPDPVASRVCWTTELPWGPDGVAAWRAGDVLVVAGHNLFKQAPGLGRSLAAAALGDEPALDLRPQARLGARAA